ncbi:MAG: penicillin-binding transpeptidase domain-containing protein [Gemmatimonadota bacterium]|nr:penicillin-binding transpeptidase domain-containing protein [Gemmatimonadota bacterium]
MRRRGLVDRPPAWRRRMLLVVWLIALGIICMRAGQVQLAQASDWRSMAESQHRADQIVAATRGSILDRDGTPLAVSRERVRVSIAPREIEDMEATRELLQEHLGVSGATASRLTSLERKWTVAPDLYAPDTRVLFRGVRGVYLDRVLQRFHPHGDLARGVLGTVLEGEGLGGIEQAFDELLRGTPGREVIARDNIGQAIPGERVMMDPPKAGGQVVLTLDMDLQEIVQQALAEAIEEREARGGDVIVVEPQSGEVLALVSVKDGHTNSLSAVNTPHEPGSTLKPFTVAGLLQEGLASMQDSIDVGNGTWEIEGRTLHDIHTQGMMTVADALRESSNVGIAKAAQSMTPGVQYENLRDFGFGARTGIELPGEVPGTLRRPDGWTPQSSASLAIGYEISVTSLQMAMAYGALANGGILMQPRLISETRNSEGATVRSFGSQKVRQVVSQGVAGVVRQGLVDVVEDGTGTLAQLASFRVAGKSGTARSNSGNGYEEGAYYSSFVSIFPAENPQLVIVVGLDRPQGAYYGGAVAAPVTRATMEAALAARATPLDRGALVKAAQPNPTPPQLQETRFAARTLEPPVLTLLPDQNGALGVSLPDVSGLASRVAIRRLHGLGLRVFPGGSGEIWTTYPLPGERVLPGDTIHLHLQAKQR